MTRPDVLLIPCGEALLPEHLELGFFAALIVGVAPEELRLSHLVEHLRRTAGEAPRRRHGDAAPPYVLPLKHPALCCCAVCITTRRRAAREGAKIA